VYAIVLHWNTYEDTKECLQSLRKTAYGNYKVVLVDNGSDDNSGFRLHEEYPETHFIHNDENLGYPEGNNVGIRYAMDKGAEYAVLLNSDIIVDPDYLTALVDVAESDERIGIVGSKVLFYHQPNVIQTAGGKINWWLGRIKNYGGPDTGQYDKIMERDYVYGTCMLIKRQVIERIGGLDPQFFFSIEEYDYCPRARQAGFKTMYAPKSRIWHKKGASAKKLGERPETLALISRKAGLLMWKYHWKLFQKHLPTPFFIIPFLACMFKALFVVSKRILSDLFRGNIKPLRFAMDRIWYRMKLALRL
jgi:GT2 family glycosyltransferase